MIPSDNGSLKNTMRNQLIHRSGRRHPVKPAAAGYWARRFAQRGVVKAIIVRCQQSGTNAET